MQANLTTCSTLPLHLVEQKATPPQSHFVQPSTKSGQTLHSATEEIGSRITCRFEAINMQYGIVGIRYCYAASTIDRAYLADLDHDAKAHRSQ